LLSTSSARESHEWSEFQAGVFSHEVRSGLLGAADSDGDGQITYREIAAFVERANAAVPNERFRPDVYAKEPSTASSLLDLRPGLGHRLEMSGAQSGHYFIEDTRGVRLADFHNAPGQAVHMIRPASSGPLYLRKLADNTNAEIEYRMDVAPDVLRFEDLRPRPSTAQARGAAHDSFRLLFVLPFSQQEVDTFVVREPVLVAEPEPPQPRAEPGLSLRRPVGFGLLAVGAVAAAGGTWALISALDARPHAGASQLQMYEANARIENRNQWSLALYGVSGAALASGAIVLLWPTLTGKPAPAAVGVIPRPDGGALVGWSGGF